MPLMRRALAVALLAAACNGHDLSAMAPGQSGEQWKVIPISRNRQVDLLFVIDDSASMRQEQGSLAANVPLFIDVLQSVTGGMPDLHIGVVSTDLGTGPAGGGGEACAGDGDAGLLQVPVGCPPLAGGARFISDVEIDEETGARAVNYPGTLAEQFACMARLGTDGCGFEQPLEAAARALENRDQNAGFLRDGAYLMVVFVTDEDDCSVVDRAMFDATQDDRDAPLGELSSFRCFEFGTTCDQQGERAVGPRTGCVPGDDDTRYMSGIEPYAERLRAVRPEPGRLIVAAISAGAAPVAVSVDPDSERLEVDPACVVCPGGGATGCPLDPGADGAALVAAAPAIRLNAFLARFPQRATWQDICTYDPAIDDVNLAGALVQIATSFGNLPLSMCLGGDLAMPLECVVSEIIDPGTAAAMETLIPSCDDAAPTCYRIAADPRCDDGSGGALALDIERDGPPPVAPTEIAIRCLTDT